MYVAGPCSPGDVARKVAAAVRAGDQLLEAGLVPYVPHLAVVWDFLRPRGDWSRLRLAWLGACDALVRISGESAEADAEVAWCRERGIPVFGSVGEAVAALGDPAGRSGAAEPLARAAAAARAVARAAELLDAELGELAALRVRARGGADGSAVECAVRAAGVRAAAWRRAEALARSACELADLARRIAEEMRVGEVEVRVESDGGADEWSV